MATPQKDHFGEMRASGVRDVLVIAAIIDSHHVESKADGWFLIAAPGCPCALARLARCPVALRFRRAVAPSNRLAADA
jgi:hypothetical protein